MYTERRGLWNSRQTDVYQIGRDLMTRSASVGKANDQALTGAPLVLDRMGWVVVVTETMQPEHISLWLRDTESHE